MGVYLVSVEADDWLDEEVLGPVGRAVDTALAGRGLPPFVCPPVTEFRAGSGRHFEEKMYRPLSGFSRFCEELGDGTAEALVGWDVLLPVGLEAPLVLPVECAYNDVTAVGDAHRALDAARRLAELLALPPGIPERCDNLEIGNWFDGRADAAAVASPGRWTEDLDIAFYAALFLRAAEYTLRTGRPLAYS
ncbi:hypothetical protein ACFCX4_36035 [Kitasatospora sp. NPDC056327]|uniref:hypothetical protein n=1 Tax=Kitasatospora sp. NPDC056327 TaxID=3345785 RepID=UPI0035DAE65E